MRWRPIIAMIPMALLSDYLFDAGDWEAWAFLAASIWIWVLGDWCRD